MKLEIAKKKYIETWGALATNWGINRTMAQIHALLLISPNPLNAEEIMEELKISRGNANMNLRALMDWGIVNKDLVAGERKEFFKADKDVWEIFKQIAKERKKREIEPVIKALEEIQDIDEKSIEAKEFSKIIKDINSLSIKLSNVMDMAIKADENWFLSKITYLLKK